MPRKTPAPPPRADLAQSNDPVVETKGDDIHITFDTRHYRVRGLERNTSPHQLRVNLLATRDDLVHLDTLVAT